MIEIPEPEGWPEECISALNYRVQRWEIAHILELRYIPTHTRTQVSGEKYEVKGRWIYEVWIKRPWTTDTYGRRRGGGYRLTLSGDDVRRIPQEQTKENT